jgi:hypothetical protein
MPSRRLSPLIILALIVGFLLLRVALFAVTTATEYALYRDYAKDVRRTSLAELHQARDVEYPPLATLFGVAVLHVAEALPDGADRLTVFRPEETRGVGPARYEVALGLVLFAVDVACLLFVYLLARRLYPEESTAKRLALYVAATSAIGLIFYDRQDPVVGLVAVMMVATVARGWSLIAYAVLAAGVAYKLVPLLLFPPCVLAFAALRTAPGSTRQFLRASIIEAAIAGAILALVPALMYLFCGGERAFAFLTFHSKRGLQLEASAAWPVILLDPGTQLGHSFGSYTLRGDLPDRVARVSSFATALGAIICVFIAARGFWRAVTSGRPADRNKLTIHLVASALLVWLGFILLSKVGSPQYLLWLAPLVSLLPLRGSDRWWAALLLAGMVLATLIYPCVYYKEVRGAPTGDENTFCGPSSVGFALLAAKSIVYSVAFVWLAVLVWRAKPGGSSAMESR